MMIHLQFSETTFFWRHEKPFLRWKLCTASLVALSLLSSTTLVAQDNATRSTNNQVKQADSQTSYGILSSRENDRQIVRWLIPDQHGVIECSKLALEKSTNESVKQFARLMVTEHSSCLDKLEGISKHSSTPGDVQQTSDTITNRKGDVKVDARRSGILIRDEGTQRDNKIVYQPTDFVQVKVEVCDQMRALIAKEMKAMPGSEFDRAYMKHMVAGHEMNLASCKAVRKTASSELQTMLDQNIEKLNVHLKQARQLCDEVCQTSTTGKLDTQEATRKVR